MVAKCNTYLDEGVWSGVRGRLEIYIIDQPLKRLVSTLNHMPDPLKGAAAVFPDRIKKLFPKFRLTGPGIIVG